MRVVRGKQVSKKGAYYAMWLTSDTKFNEVIRSICLKSDDMQFWLYNYNQIKYFDLDTSSTRQRMKVEGVYLSYVTETWNEV